MRGAFQFKLLEALSEAAHSTASLCDVFLTDYHTSYRRLRGLSRLPHAGHGESRVDAYERQRFYDTLSKLKKQGFTVRTKARHWHITEAGLKKFRALHEQIARLLPPIQRYKPKLSSELNIVTFDIPERERKKRAWLRAVLKRLDFKKLQQSVWIGKAQLPEEFMDDMRRLRLLPFVEIFSVTKTGSLRHVA